MNVFAQNLRNHLLILLLCLFQTVLNFNPLFAADNSALVSTLLSNGTVVMPRSSFTQTWTLTNTGTTSWTVGSYGLRLIGTDSLGAVALQANKNSTNYAPQAAPNSYQSVSPGSQNTYSMTFIAPELAGSYTDTFQMVNASGTPFGAQVTMQVVVAQAGSTNQYDRALAVSYANNYAGYVASDGYFWTNGSGYGNFGALAPVPTAYLGDDCAHFLSSCIGRSNKRGGGLSIPSRVPPTYGEPGAARLIQTCLLASGYAVEVSSITQLSPGDVIGWNWEGDTNLADIDHATLYIGNGQLASHSTSALGVSDLTFFQSSEPNWKWHLIHILDAPTLVSTKKGTNLMLSWGTNWTGYSLYSSTSMSPGATWTKVIKSPVVVGTSNLLTNSMTSTAAFYRLQLP